MHMHPLCILLSCHGKMHGEAFARLTGKDAHGVDKICLKKADRQRLHVQDTN